MMAWLGGWIYLLYLDTCNNYSFMFILNCVLCEWVNVMCCLWCDRMGELEDSTYSQSLCE
jgi:hypothetical protein